MADLYFVDAHSETIRLRQDFGIHHRADRADLHAIKNGALENLKRAIDVPDLHAEDHSDQGPPTPGVNQAVRWVLPFGAVAGDDLVMAGPLDKVFKFLQVELSIRIGEKNVVVARGENAAFQSGSITAIIGVVDGPNLRVLLGELVAERGSRVFTAIVNQNDFPRLRQFG